MNNAKRTKANKVTANETDTLTEKKGLGLTEPDRQQQSPAVNIKAIRSLCGVDTIQVHMDITKFEISHDFYQAYFC